MMPTQKELDDLAPWFQAITFPDGKQTPGWDVTRVLETLIGDRSLTFRTVLDIGCMAGAAMLWAEACGATCWGFDIEPRSITQAELVRREFGASFEVEQGDL